MWGHTAGTIRTTTRGTIKSATIRNRRRALETMKRKRALKTDAKKKIAQKNETRRKRRALGNDTGNKFLVTSPTSQAAKCPSVLRS